MAVKVDFVLDDDVKNDLDRLVESGRRSRIINEALRKELLQIKRQKLAEKHDRLRGQTNAISTWEIVRAIRQDRGRA
jgi:Arc/MetJ-type ribon-helix-helix transcriptional regulator